MSITETKRKNLRICNYVNLYSKLFPRPLRPQGFSKEKTLFQISWLIIVK
jgi:hypothetical protein